MNDISRYLSQIITADALDSGKIAFINGPRQVGKTTLAQQIKSKKYPTSHYFNFDDDEFKKIWIQSPKDIVKNYDKKSLLIFDEIHKDRNWKNKIKGLYDIYKNDFGIIITGSARLDYYRKSGDSLQGRYLPYQLHPISLGEESYIKPPPQKDWEENAKIKYDYDDLLNLGGFPEPLLTMSQEKTLRWKRLYRERMIHEDLRDLHQVRDIQQVDSLALLLQDRAGSQLSYESLRQDLSVSFETVQRWIASLEVLFYCYRIKPYSKNIKNSIKKEPKLYLYDWALAPKGGARLENMVASHLLKSCDAWTQSALGEYELFYVRDKQKREVDFFITENKKPYALIEVKSSDAKPSEALKYYQQQLKPKFCFQIVENELLEKKPSLANPNLRIMSVKKFLSALV